MKWLVGEDIQVNFWEDTWLMGKPLVRTKFGILREHLQLQVGSKVMDFIGLDRRWKKIQLH